jgi:hypothetical protein
LSNRGSRRIIEKKKYKCLGEISALTKMLDEIRVRHAAKIKEMEVQKPVKIVAEKTFRTFLGIPGMESNRSEIVETPKSS